MIRRERLRELFKQGKTVYVTIMGFILDYDLKDDDICMSSNIGYALRKFDSLGYWEDIPEEQVFETFEEAEWYLEFGNITRTETLSLPSWEEIAEKQWLDIDIFANSGMIYILTIDDCYKDQPVICINRVSEANDYFAPFEKPLTKENYIEACLLARSLFLGENKKTSEG